MSAYGYYSSLAGFWIIFIVVWVLANVGLAFIPASMAKKKGYSYGAFWCLSFFASFLVGIIVAAVITDKNPQQPYTQGYAQPPYGQPYPPNQPPYGQPYGQPYDQSYGQTQAPPPPTDAEGYCPGCGSPYTSGAAFCSKCGARLK